MKFHISEMGSAPFKSIWYVHHSIVKWMISITNGVSLLDRPTDLYIKTS